MRVGFVNIYGYRPMVQAMQYLAWLLESDGHYIGGLVCDAALPYCHARAFKGSSKVLECPRCMLGGYRTFRSEGLYSIRADARANLPEAGLADLARSTAQFLLRLEKPSDEIKPEFHSLVAELSPAVDIVFQNTLDWISKESLDAVLLFNGRIDVLAGVAAACRSAHVPFVTCERAWAGDGINMNVNDSCSSLNGYDKMHRAFRDSALTEGQAARAGKLIALRMLRQNYWSWRLHGAANESVVWPGKRSGSRVLLCPSSMSEVRGHQDYCSGWSGYEEAYDTVIQKLGVPYEQCVLRCHPFWSEQYGRARSDTAAKHYTNWAGARGIKVISSEDQVSTIGLIAESDILLVNGSTAGLEAAAIGKPVISVGPCSYQEGDVAVQVQSRERLDRVGQAAVRCSRDISRHALRSIYVLSRRFPQFAEFVSCIQHTRNEYYAGANAARLVRTLQSGVIEADDPRVAPTAADEDRIITALLNHEWAELSRAELPAQPRNFVSIGRRPALRWIDPVRSMFTSGDNRAYKIGAKGSQEEAF